jgi:resuscitation-promoting factor RpfA
MTRASTWFGGAARACVVIGATVSGLSWAAGPPADSWRVLTSSASSASGEVGFDHLLVSVAALAAWVALSWFCAITGLAFASVAPGALGRLCAKTSQRLTPRLLRRFIEAVVGISVLAGPLGATSAFAASPAPAASASTAAADAGRGSSGWTSDLDRPTSQIAPASRPPLYLDRPANPYVAQSPRPVVTLAPAGSAALIAGSPHRDAHDGTGASYVESYVVRRGDALWDIAARHLGVSATAADVAREWPRWYDANRAVIGDDPALIRPGELLVPP